LVVGLVVGAIVLGSLALTGTFVWRHRSKRLEVEMEGNVHFQNCPGNLMKKHLGT
jgi:hypothetical protein